MVLARAWSVALSGVDGIVVEIEANLGSGQPAVQLVGLPDAALHEARDRVRAAVTNSGQEWPNQRITLGLSPADLRKGGSGYDLALACALLAAAGVVPATKLMDTVLLGELALDGRIRPIHGTLPSLLAARRAGLRRAIVPVAALPEAALVDDMTVWGACQLTDVLGWLADEPDLLVGPGNFPEPPQPVAPPDLQDVLGQPEARWALEIAAAGGHHLLLVGPPGTGKTMLAKRLPGLLPPLSTEEILEVTAIHSIAGTLPAQAPVVTGPPFIAPHHSASVAALIGGGTGLAKPGAISRAHRGILFLDETCEFSARQLEALRTAVEDGEIRLARRDGVVCYPAQFQLVLATNPCPCAPPRDIDCTCSSGERRRYFGKLSGPLLDRIDLSVQLRPVTTMVMRSSDVPESSAVVRERVQQARERAAKRWSIYGWRTNAEVAGPALRRDFPLPNQVTAVLDRGLATGAVSVRGADRCLRVAWTLADLADRDQPTAEDVSAALQFRHRRTL